MILFEKMSVFKKKTLYKDINSSLVLKKFILILAFSEILKAFGLFHYILSDSLLNRRLLIFEEYFGHLSYNVLLSMSVRNS